MLINILINENLNKYKKYILYKKIYIIMLQAIYKILINTLL